MARVAKKSSSRKNLTWIVSGAVVVVGVATGLILSSGGSSTKTSALPTNLCGAWKAMSTYNAAHPPQHTYPDLKRSLTSSYDALSAVTTAPQPVSSNLGEAVKASRAMITVVDEIIAKKNLSAAQKTASLNDIKVWASSTKAIATWSKSHC